MRFPDDDSEIPVNDVIDFYNRLIKECNNDKIALRERIREFARQTIDMKVVMKPVIDYVEGD